MKLMGSYKLPFSAIVASVSILQAVIQMLLLCLPRMIFAIFWDQFRHLQEMTWKPQFYVIFVLNAVQASAVKALQGPTR